jgi:HlyD family secretion protein
VKLPGETRKIIPTADRQKATVKVKVSFKEIDPRILPDMSAKVTFIQKAVSATTDQSSRVTVPKSAVVQRDGKTVVLVLTNDRVQQQTVAVGSDLGDRVEIKQGLAGGKTVVVRGGENLADGARVKLKTGS